MRTVRPGRRSPGGSPSDQAQFWALTSQATDSSAEVDRDRPEGDGQE